MPEYKTPYSFVPISNEVFFPDWADKISQDIPFSDAISGSISFDIIAKTPIFVRNGQKQNGKDTSFSKAPDGSFFIPGSSIKGEMASVLRMMSYGKMGLVDNKTFGNRNINDASFRERMKEVLCGWMRLTKDGAVIIDCDRPGRISVSRIDEFFRTNIESFIKNKENFNLDENRTAKSKYRFIKDSQSLRQRFVSDDELAERMHSKNPKDTRDFVTFASSTQKVWDWGRIVFTGQPGVRKQISAGRSGRPKWTGKFYEFVFFEYEDVIEHKVSDTVFKQFESIHASSPDYEGFWKKKLYDGEEIPVFFILNEDGKSIHSIGLSYMYKYPYNKSIYDAIPEIHRNSRNDLTDCLFGSIKDKSNPYKGRVQFGHAKVQGIPIPLSPEKFGMSQPRASFYPFYVEGGKSWDDAEKISGHKRYPIRLGQQLTSPQGTKEMESEASMLPEGTVFKETVHFHNLRPVELGALLSAITFHGQERRCFHSIGLGKPLGYGAVAVSNVILDGIDVYDVRHHDIKEYMSVFEDTMTRFKGNWLSSPAIVELLLMAQGIPLEKESHFKYMELKDFKEAKKNHISLASFSNRIGKIGYVLPSIKKSPNE